ncbi:MAG: ketoacyl-ACP synthase III [Verrucomicrobiae bacterium]|nr:ketoacyl-ACP synthase III [Verrucomicrobiae bacterium]
MSASEAKTANPFIPSLNNAVIAGTGSHLPSRVLSNADLEKMVETSDEWITSRTGIKERRIAAADEYTSHLGAAAALKALTEAGVKAEDVDLIICATITPDMPFPNTASLIQEKIGARRAACFDLEAACTGFLYGLEVGRQFIATGAHQTVLVVAAEKISAITDWKDRNTCVLFGDGAGAAVLRPSATARGIIRSCLGSNGALAHLISMPGGGSQHPASLETVNNREHFLKMQGREVYKHAVLGMSQAALHTLQLSGLKAEDITCILPHQANVRIIEGVADRIGVPLEKFYLNLHRYGNMSAASVAIAMDEAAREGRFKRGDFLLMVAFGAGLTWGATALQW